jgi:hypothetical protein
LDLADFLLAWALEIFAARFLDMPLSRNASYVFGFLTDGPGDFLAGIVVLRSTGGLTTDVTYIPSSSAATHDSPNAGYIQRAVRS